MSEISFRLEPNETITIDGGRSLAKVQTAYQHVEIIELPNLGETIFIDGVPQISAADAVMFNEVVAHAPLCAIESPTVVFLAGVASGGAVGEILKHPSVETIYAVDIDREAMEFLAKYLSFSSFALLSNPKVTLVYDDARKVLSEIIKDRAIDAIIVDVPDPLIGAPSQQLFTREFYALARRKLNNGGALLTQSGRFRLGAMSYHAGIRAACDCTFNGLKTYHFYYPCYYEPWSFLLCNKEGTAFPTKEYIDQTLANRNITDLRFYGGEIDQSISRIPAILAKEVNLRKADILRSSVHGGRV